jgi:polyisoprenoid-binding protein YceI
MNKLNKTFRIITVAVLVMLGSALQAQQTLTLNGNSELKVTGTSTIHDWDMVSNSGQTGKATMKLDGGKITDLKTLQLTMPVSTLKSGRSAMDKNAYEALKAKENPNVQFQLTEVLSITDNTIKAKGNLTVAGTTRNVPMEVNYKVSGNTVQFTGTQDIKFTQFNISPPTAVFNTIKTGDDLTLSFNATFK